MPKKLYPMPTHCPVSGSPLQVTRLESPVSGLVIEGQFEANEFALLAQEQLEFLRIFVKVRGNLKEVERILGLSYPTVRLRFEGLLKSLGYEALEEGRNERADIIAMLERGDLSPEEAAVQLRALKKRQTQ